MLCTLSLFSPIASVSSQWEIELYFNPLFDKFSLRNSKFTYCNNWVHNAISVISYTDTNKIIRGNLISIFFFAFVAFLSYRMLKRDICCPSKFAKIKYPMLLKYVETSSILSADTKEITPFTWELLAILTRQVQ